LIRLIRKITNEELVHESEDFPIAILTFINMYSDPEQEYFSYGTSEDLLNVLATSANSNVAAHSHSLFYFKGQNFPVIDVMKALGVEHVIKGNIRNITFEI
jgi:TolB-like protein